MVDFISYYLADLAQRSSISSSIVCVANGDDAEIDYVITSLIHHNNNNKTEILTISKSVDNSKELPYLASMWFMLTKTKTEISVNGIILNLIMETETKTKRKNKNVFPKTSK